MYQYCVADLVYVSTDKCSNPPEIELGQCQSHHVAIKNASMETLWAWHNIIPIIMLLVCASAGCDYPIDHT